MARYVMKHQGQEKNEQLVKVIVGHTLDGKVVITTVDQHRSERELHLDPEEVRDLNIATAEALAK